MRADNQGEGGILALLALVRPGSIRTRGEPGARRRFALIALGLFGAALLLRRRRDHAGDLGPRRGRGPRSRDARVSSPSSCRITIVDPRRAVPGAAPRHRRRRRGLRSGDAGLVRGDRALRAAVDPAHDAGRARARSTRCTRSRFFLHNGVHGFLVLGSVVLCVTGGEALYADMGHFGRKPDPRRLVHASCSRRCCSTTSGRARCCLERRRRRSATTRSSRWRRPGRSTRWSCSRPSRRSIASQALISGAFSLTQQAVQLGFWPRVTIVHTSRDGEGQIYIPEVNWPLMVACVALVLGFRAVVQRWRRRTASRSPARWRSRRCCSTRSRARAGAGRVWQAGGAVRRSSWSIDLAFFGANVVKIAARRLVPARGRPRASSP